MAILPRILRPTAPPCEQAILVGDPGRALLLAQQLLVAPAPMFNHHRGLWGYSGPTASGNGDLLIQGTGMGGPSLAAVVTDLIELGVKSFVRVGTAAAATSSCPAPGGILIARDAVASDGTSRSLTAGVHVVAADPGLVASAVADLSDSAALGRVLSCDLPQTPPSWADEHASDAIDMSTAALYALCESEGIPAVSLLVITGGETNPLAENDLNEAVCVAGSTATRLLQP